MSFVPWCWICPCCYGDLFLSLCRVLVTRMYMQHAQHPNVSDWRCTWILTMYTRNYKRRGRIERKQRIGERFRVWVGAWLHGSTQHGREASTYGGSNVCRGKQQRPSGYLCVVYVCMYVCTCMYACMHTHGRCKQYRSREYLCVTCMCVCMYVCTHIPMACRVPRLLWGSPSNKDGWVCI
jgi:hypothetical protein